MQKTYKDINALIQAIHTEEVAQLEEKQNEYMTDEEWAQILKKIEPKLKVKSTTEKLPLASPPKESNDTPLIIGLIGISIFVLILITVWFKRTSKNNQYVTLILLAWISFSTIFIYLAEPNFNVNQQTVLILVTPIILIVLFKIYKNIKNH